MPLSKIDVLPVNLRNEPDNLNTKFTAEQIKDLLQKNPEHIKKFIDELIDKLNATTDGNSGADNIGATELGGISGATVQTILESLKAHVDNNDTTLQNNIDTLETLLSSNSGASTVGGSVTGLTGTTVQALLTALKQYVDTHKTSADHDGRYYRKSELDGGALDGRYYTEEETNTKFTSKDEITTNRKLSATGDFTGTLKGMEITAAEPGLSSAFNAHLADNTLNYGDTLKGINNGDDITARIANSSASKIVIPDGNYVVTELEHTKESNIVLSRNTKITGSTDHYNFNIKSNNTVISSGESEHPNININIQNPVNDIKIKDMKLKGGYGVLVNTGSYGGKNLLVEGNNISSKYDAIEVNTYETDNGQYENRFKNTIINNNFIEVIETELSDSTKLMSIGIAEGHNVIVNNVISEKSAREGFHVEDGSENVILSNGIFEDCALNGARLYLVRGGTQNQPLKQEEFPLITNSIFIGSDETTSKTFGLIAERLDNTQHTIGTFVNNMFKNFDCGISVRADNIFNLDGTQIFNCTEGMNLYDARVKGCVMMHGVTYPIVLFTSRRQPSVVDSIMINTNVVADNIITGNGTLVCNNLEWQISTEYTAAATKFITVLPNIYYFKGTIIVDLNFSDTDPLADHHSSLIADVVIQNGTITQTKISNEDYGQLVGDVQFYLNTNNLQVKCFSAKAATVKAKMKMVGTLIIKRTT